MNSSFRPRGTACILGLSAWLIHAPAALAQSEQPESEQAKAERSQSDNAPSNAPTNSPDDKVVPLPAAPIGTEGQAQGTADATPTPAPTDPDKDAQALELLKQSADKLAEITSLRFSIERTGGGLSGRGPAADKRATVLMSRPKGPDGKPTSTTWTVRMTGRGPGRPADGPVDFDVVWKDNTVRYIDHKEKKVVQQPAATQPRSSYFIAALQLRTNNPYFDATPFRSENAAPMIALRDNDNVGGIECKVILAGKTLEGSGTRTRLSVGADDLLPRKIEQILENEKLGNSTTTTTIIDLEINPEIDAAAFEIEVPADYTVQTNEAPPTPTPTPSPTPGASEQPANPLAPAPTSPDAAPNGAAVAENFRDGASLPQGQAEALESGGESGSQPVSPITPPPTAPANPDGSTPEAATAEANAAAAPDAASNATPAPTPKPAVLTALPDFELQAVGGTKFSSSALKDSVVVMQFFGSWSGPARRSHPDLQTLADTHKDGPQAAKFVLVSLRERAPQTVGEYAKDAKLSMPVLLAGEKLAEQFGVKVPPTTIIFNRDGSIRGTVAGYSGQATTEKITRLLNDALSNAPASTNASTTTSGDEAKAANPATNAAGSPDTQADPATQQGTPAEAAAAQGEGVQSGATQGGAQAGDAPPTPPLAPGQAAREKVLNPSKKEESEDKGGTPEDK